MGIFDKLRNEFIDIVEWTDNSNDTLVYRFPRYENEIKMGAKLTVRESQNAVFVNEGQIADLYLPGLHDLQTQNMPILTTLKGWKYGFNSPFKAEVYFVSMRNFTDRKWGTKNPIMMRDAEFGPIRLRAFGSFALKVKDPKKLLKELAGTDAHFTTDEITEQLKNIIVTRFSDALGEAKIPALDLAAKYDEISKMLTEKVRPEFDELGLDISKLLIENISLPPEVEAVMDKRTSMGIVGNLGAYSQFQAANSMEKAAESGNSMMGGGMGMGMGFGMANQMGNMFQQNQFNPNQGNNQQGTPPPVPPSVQYFAAVNGVQAGPFNEQALTQMVQQGTLKGDTLVWKQGMANWIAASQVNELTNLFGATPPPLPPQ